MIRFKSSTTIHGSFFLCLFFLCLSPVSLAARPRIDVGDLKIKRDSLPVIHAPHRRPDTSSWKIVPYRGAKNARAVHGAIQALAPRSVLQLPAGTYSGPLGIHGKNEVVVRGDCKNPGAVRWRHAGNPDNVIYSGGTLCGPGWARLCGANYGDQASAMFGRPVRWQGPYARGTRKLKVADTRQFAVGEIVWISATPPPRPRTDIRTDDLNYMSEIVAKGARSITIQGGLHIDFGPRGATITPLKKPLRNSGIECLSMQQTNPGAPAGLYKNIVFATGYAYESWFYNVDFGDTFNNHGKVSRSARILIHSSTFGEQHKSRRGNRRNCNARARVQDNPCWNKQAIVYDEAHDSSLINSIVRASIGIEYAHSSSGNWTAYNYFPFPKYHPAGEPRRALFPHGNYAHSNVMEGNVLVDSVGEMDEVWGSQGPYYTWYRNVAAGPRARLSMEVWANKQNGGVVSRYANYILNYATRFGLPGAGMDTRSHSMHLERNVYATDFVYGIHPSAQATTAVENIKSKPGVLPRAWHGLDLPDSLNLALDGKTPEFWCKHTVRRGGRVCDFSVKRGIGAFWDGKCILPAQARADGIVCN